ncbi:MAG TPA: tetratricopeptide repeat protein [Oceanobacillus sp.]|nr:tetratricopeptide repeat protein [Oceanobacillus sp.]
MYLRTPKRYQVGRRPKRHLFSTRWLWLWILTPIVVVLGWQVYERREEFGPPVQAFVDNLVSDAQNSLSTAVAPTPLPTIDPSQQIAQANDAWNRGAIEEALQGYRAVLENAPNDVIVHYRVAFGLLMEGRDEEALEMAERTVTANPFASDAWAIRALALDRNERPAEAIASALQALSLNPNNARAMAFMAEAYLDSNLPERAAETVSRALDADPESFEAHYVNGLILRDSQFDFQGASEAFEIAHDIAPNLPYIVVELAWTEVSLFNYERAQELLQEVLELNPQNLDALFALSWLSRSAFGDHEAAMEYIERCVQVDPQNRTCLRYKATLLELVGDMQGAVENYQRLIRAGTTNPGHFLAAGQAFIAVGQCSSAVTVLEEGYQLERDSDAPDAERLATFESLLLQCGADITPVFSADATAEATAEATTEGE